MFIEQQDIILPCLSQATCDSGGLAAEVAFSGHASRLEEMNVLKFAYVCECVCTKGEIL